jgi:tetratricopeptide (TPR) repeat protein
MSEPTTSTPIAGTSLADIENAQPAVERFVDKHQMKLVALVLLLIIAVLAYVVQREIGQNKEKAAGALLVSKTETADLEGVFKNFDGTAAAGSAKILFAEKQWSEGKKDDAIQTLRGIVESAPAHPARASALASLASKLRSQGETAEAEKFFTELTEDAEAHYLAAYAWISLGDLAAAKGDVEAAEKAYATVEKDYSDDIQATQDAVTRRLLLKASSPVEIAAPTKPLDTKIIDAEGNPSDEVKIKNMVDPLKAAGQETPPSPPPAEKGAGQ